MSVSIVSFRGARSFMNGLGRLLEAEWNFTSGFTPHPVTQYGTDIVLAKVVVLFQCYMPGEILFFNVIALCPLQFSLGDSALSCAGSYR